MIYRSLCTVCVHFSNDEETDKPICIAFPGRIPKEILPDAFDHRNEYPGDGGIRFTPDGPVDQDVIDGIVNPKQF
jgi:hypothetical protein